MSRLAARSSTVACTPWAASNIPGFITAGRGWLLSLRAYSDPRPVPTFEPALVDGLHGHLRPRAGVGETNARLGDRHRAFRAAIRRRVAHEIPPHALLRARRP